MVRDEQTGELKEASWTEALRIAADGLLAARKGKGAGVLTGGRLTVEDAYAYAKFARIALRTNDIDFRARPHSAEELDFLASTVLGATPDNGASPTPTSKPRPPCCRSRSSRRRSRRSCSCGCARRPARTAPGSSRSPARPRPRSRKTFGTLLACEPGAETAAVDGLLAHAPDVTQALGRPGAVVLVGERAAVIPGLFAAVRGLVTATGAKLAWIPRRAGERGALEAGAVPNLLPGGRPVTDAAARADIERAWGLAPGTLPEALGLDTDGIIAAAAAGQLGALVVGGRRPRRPARPGTGRRRHCPRWTSWSAWSCGPAR